MSEPIVLKADDLIVQSLHFKPHRSIAQRRVKPFIPAPHEPQTKEVTTPWGSKLTVTKGDLLISELDKPEDEWPIDADIFDQTYMIVAPGFCIKRAVTLLVPLEDVTGGDTNRL
ncbi:MAG: hypothetical protein L0Y55_20120, partial [Anaerolineales bacterium]|nr:hypothetical protein [Anaerolineales bacterium]